MQVTNRQLEKAFDFSLSQVRRWAVLCLGRDPEADKGGGVRREYDVDQAFKIFLFGHFIMEQDMTINEAQQHLNNIYPWLAERGLNPSNNIKKREYTKFVSIELFIYTRPQPSYEFRFCKKIEQSGHEISTNYDAYWLPESLSSYFVLKKGKSYTIYVDALLSGYLDFVEGL